MKIEFSREALVDISGWPCLGYLTMRINWYPPIFECPPPIAESADHNSDNHSSIEPFHQHNAIFSTFWISQSCFQNANSHEFHASKRILGKGYTHNLKMCYCNILNLITLFSTDLLWILKLISRLLSWKLRIVSATWNNSTTLW